MDMMLIAIGVLMAVIGLMNSTSGETSGGSSSSSAAIFFILAAVCFAAAFRGMLMH